MSIHPDDISKLDRMIERDQFKTTASGYEALARILGDAFNQSARGKGFVRHSNGKPFDKQPIMEIGRMVGIGGHTYQVCKKAQEATSMAARSEIEAAKAELRGAIIYAAAAILLLEEQQHKREGA